MPRRRGLAPIPSSGGRQASLGTAYIANPAPLSSQGSIGPIPSAWTITIDDFETSLDDEQYDDDGEGDLLIQTDLNRSIDLAVKSCIEVYHLEEPYSTLLRHQAAAFFEEVVSRQHQVSVLCN